MSERPTAYPDSQLPSDERISDQAMAYDVAHAEKGPRDTIVELTKMQQILGPERADTYDQVIEDFKAAAQHAGNTALQEAVELRDSTARQNILSVAEAKEGERKTFSTKETYVSHATLFYDALGKEYSANPQNEEVHAAWQKANIVMAESALKRQEPSIIADKYYKQVQDPAQKWGLVAKAHRSGNSLLAQQWEEPLLQALEDEQHLGQVPVTTTLAMFKAKTSMAADRLQLADKRADRKQYTNEMKEQWSKANEIMGRSKDLGPKWEKGSVTPDQDKRQQMLDFTKLFYEVGDFKTGDAILGQIKELNEDVKRQGQAISASSEATKATNDFIESAELRQLCYGMTPEEVREHAGAWLSSRKNTQETRWAMSSISGFDDRYKKQINKLDAQKNNHTGASRFLSDHYPELVEPHRLNTISARLQVGAWDRAFSTYYGSVAGYGKYDAVNNVEAMAEALEIAQYGPQFEQSELFKAAHNDTEHIKLIAAAYTQRAQEVDTTDKVNLQDAALEDIDRFYKREYGTPELNAAFATAIFDALKVVTPDGDYNKVKAYMTSVLKGSLSSLSTIPGNSEELAAQRALLSSALDKAEVK
jgi:hypothetical protein